MCTFCFSVKALTDASLPPLETNQRNPLDKTLESPKASAITVGVLTALAFALRFYRINHPDQVV